MHMRISILKLKEMIPGTAPWVGEQADQFKQIPEIAGLWPLVVEVHRQVLEAQIASEASAQIERLTGELEEADEAHDHMIRAIYFSLSAAIDYLLGLNPPRLEEAKRYEAVLSLLLPEGLSWVKKSFAEQSGNAATAVTMLTPELEAVLRKIPLLEASTFHAVQAWGVRGAELGRLERLRSELQAILGAQVNFRQARLEWIRVVQKVLELLEFTRVPKAQVTALRQPMLDLIRKAEGRAAARVDRKTAGQDANTPDAPNAPDAETPDAETPVSTPEAEATSSRS